MPFWLVALVFIGISIGLELLRPKPKLPNAVPKTFGDFNFPTAEETRPIPYAAGTVRQQGINVIWAGDFLSTAITKSRRTGLFSKQDQIVGYRYHVGMVMALCHGTVDSVQEITLDDGKYSIFTGDLNLDAEETTIIKEDLFGGEYSETGSAEGGINVVLRFYTGARTQTPDSYLEARTGGTHPAYRGMSYITWQGPSGGAIYQAGKYVSNGGYVGTSGYLKPIEIIFKRIPRNLNPAYAEINGDANPIEVMYEVMTSYAFGADYAPAQLGASFAATAQQVYNEGLGVSFIQDNAPEGEALIGEMLKVVDGVLYSDLETGLIEISLVRGGYDAGTLLSLTDQAGISEMEFSRPLWEETSNEVVVNYVDPANKYRVRPYKLQHLANVNLQGGQTISQTLDYKGIRSGDLAATLAARDLRVLAYPLARATIRADRRAYSLKPGDVFKISWAPLGITDLVMRAIEIRYGRLGESEIEIEAVEDVFSAGTVVFQPATPSGSSPPSSTALAVSTQLFHEAPYFVSGSSTRIMAAAKSPGGLHLNFDLYVSTDGGSNYSLIASGVDFAGTGTLSSSYAALTAAKDTGQTLIIAPDGDMPLFSATPEQIAEGSNLAVIVEPGGEFEWIAYENPIVAGGTVKFDKVWRGLLDTPPIAHAAGARVWFFTGLALPEEAYSGTVKIKHVTRTTRETLSLAGATAYTLAIAATPRQSRPLLPGNLRIEGGYLTVNVSGDITLDWSHRDRLSQSTVVAQDAGDIGPEAGTTYEVRVYGGAAKTLLHTQTGLSGTSWTWTSAAEIGAAGGLYVALEFRIRAVRSGIDSLTDYVRAVTRTDGTLP